MGREVLQLVSRWSIQKDTDNNKLIFATKDFVANPEIPALKSGDVVVISANGYDDLTFKLVIDTNGNASLVEDDGKGDPYELHVKIEGEFEAAIVGQKDYDGVSSASVGGSSSNKNSAVKVYGALVEKGKDVADKDWEELDNMAKIKLNGSKCSVSIVPDTEKGTSADSDSGMQGVYMTISSDLTLSGTPKILEVIWFPCLSRISRDAAQSATHCHSEFTAARKRLQTR